MKSDGNNSGQAELTRREWLLKLGQTGAVAGFCGIVGEAAGEMPPASPSSNETADLPPGLYPPSNDHLTHALGADGPFHPLPAGSETDYRLPREGPYPPVFFSAEEFKVVGRIVELVLGEPAGSAQLGGGRSHGAASPASDAAEWVDFLAANSAGAREAARKLAPEHRILAVHYHGREAVERLENTDVEAICREGLAWLAKTSQEKFRGGFLGLSESEQRELLSEMGGSPKTAPEPAARFFRWIKGQIIHGFYQSPAGLRELDYKGNSFYAESPGCSGHGQPGTDVGKV